MLKRFIANTLGVALAAGVVHLACAADAPAATALDAHAYSIPAGDLLHAVETIAHQTDQQLVYQPEVLKGQKTAGVKGSYTVQEAIRKALEGTSLRLTTDPATGLMMIAPKAAAKTTGVQQSGTSGLAQADTTPPSPGQKERATGEESSSEQSNSDDLENKETSKGVSEILVKGSRTMNVDVVRTEDDVQPYTIMTSKQIEQSGATNVEDFLKQQLTSNTTTQTSAQNIPTQYGTTSAVNLRGLGTNETLILIDGRRSAGVSIQGAYNQPDINGIPLAAIDRIEVLPTSASAIYGGAAVGGVVNIVLKKDFSGGDIRYTFDKATNSSSHQQTIGGSYGFTFGETGTRIMVGGSIPMVLHCCSGTGPNSLGAASHQFSRIHRRFSTVHSNPTLEQRRMSRVLELSIFRDFPRACKDQAA